MKKRRKPHILLIVGILIGIFSGIMLTREPDLLQYLFQSDRKPSELRDDIEAVKEKLEDTEAVLTVYTDMAGMTISAEGDVSAEDIELYMVGERYAEVFTPQLIKGEFLSYDDVQTGKRNIVITEKTAFTLFGDEESLGKTVKLGGNNYTVIGVVAHTKNLGEISAEAAYIPLGCDDELPFTLSTIAVFKTGGIEQFFRDAAESVYGDGELVDLAKEKMRGFMLIRWILLVIFIRLAVMFFRFFVDLIGDRIKVLKKRLESEYFDRLFWRCALEVIAGFVLLGAALGACYFAMSFFIQPLLVFTEWVPDNLVSFAAIRTRFYELCAANAKAVRYTSRELAQIRLWSNILHWGILSGLIGSIMTIWDRKRIDK